MHTYIHAYKVIHMYICIYICICLRVYARMHVCMYASRYASMLASKSGSLMPTQFALHEECVFKTHPNFFFFPGLTGDQMTGLDAVIHRLRVAKHFTTIPCCSVDIGGCLELAPARAFAEGQQLFSERHALTVVSQRANVLKFLVELRNIMSVTAVVCEGVLEHLGLLLDGSC